MQQVNSDAFFFLWQCGHFGHGTYHLCQLHKVMVAVSHPNASYDQDPQQAEGDG
jgi:hypothetical protein